MSSREDFWPNLKTLFETGELSFDEELELECSICQEPLEVLPEQQNADGGPEGDHRPVVLPCGHVVGFQCLIAWWTAIPVREQCCPKCREDIKFNQCPHPNLGKEMPSSMDQLDDLPPLITQGGEMSEYCPVCRIYFLLDFFNQSLQNDEDIPNELKGDSLGVGLVISGREFFSRTFTGIIQELELTEKIKYLVDLHNSCATNDDEDGTIWTLLGDFIDIKVRIYHSKPELPQLGVEVQDEEQAHEREEAGNQERGHEQEDGHGHGEGHGEEEPHEEEEENTDGYGDDESNDGEQGL
ncbi:hypothetical protein IL306_002381 [Fusarium sp. DS 682]|nr:hypothetical protein IL306_002381 [Fusarium sp. DS 682]